MIKLVLILLTLNLSIDENLIGHWRMYNLEDNSFQSTLTFEDSVVYVNKHCICIGGEFEIFKEDEVLYFGYYNNINYMGSPEIVNDTLFVKVYDLGSNNYSETFYGIKSEKIYPIDVYSIDYLNVEMELPETSSTVHPDSILYSYADISIGKAITNGKNVKIGEIGIQVHDILIDKRYINDYLDEEKDKHNSNQENFLIKKPFIVKIHSSKSISQDYLSRLIRNTNLKNYPIYQAFFDKEEDRFGYKLLNNINGR